MIISVSAPGKIILAGEHAVVYGKPALVASVDKRLMVKIRQRKDGKIKIFSCHPPDQIKEAIKKFQDNLVNLTCDRLSSLPNLAGLEIKVESEIPVKLGMGSSAAVAVAMVGGLLSFVKKIKKFSPQDKELINQIAYEVEKKAHGHPSGVDNTISCFGGILWFKKGKTFKKIKIKNLPKFVLLNSGQAKETTGEMVRYIKKKIENRRKKKEIFESFAQIEKETKRLVASLKENNKEKMMRAIKACERSLENLGVVGEFAQKVVRRVENLGGVAKICGAGGIKKGSGVLLCYHQKAEKIFALAKRLNLEAFEVKLGVEGVRIESAEVGNKFFSRCG